MCFKICPAYKCGHAALEFHKWHHCPNANEDPSSAICREGLKDISTDTHPILDMDLDTVAYCCSSVCCKLAIDDKLKGKGAPAGTPAAVLLEDLEAEIAIHNQCYVERAVPGRRFLGPFGE